MLQATQAGILEPHLATMFAYLEQVASDLYRTDSNIAVACGLIGDLTKCFGANLLPLVDKKIFHALLQEGRHSKVSKTRALAVWSSKEIRKLKVWAGANLPSLYMLLNSWQTVGVIMLSSEAKSLPVPLARYLKCVREW